MAEPNPSTLPVDPHTSLVPLDPGGTAQPRRLRTEVLAGLVVALALIPEAISFSVIAGVDPAVGPFSSFVMAVTISVAGGRPAMISTATGAVAVVIAPVARTTGWTTSWRPSSWPVSCRSCSRRSGWPG